ncbi:hypothetical protein MSPP1_003910 [Malassezia sp. CBS 17886]|nr:hypothetical protein MSPP1_003910 [Malassezia sp. CBS 17886]
MASRSPPVSAAEDAGEGTDVHAHTHDGEKYRAHAPDRHAPRPPRLSLTEVFERVLEEESREQTRLEIARRKRRERWSEGRISLAQGLRTRGPTSGSTGTESSREEPEGRGGDAEDARPSPEASAADVSLLEDHVDSPAPWTPLAEVPDASTVGDGITIEWDRLGAEENRQGAEEKRQDADEVDTVADDAKTPHPRKAAAARRDSAAPSGAHQDEAVWTTLQLLKQALKQPSGEDTLANIRDVLSADAPSDTTVHSQALVGTEALASVLQRDVSLEKISGVDAHYAERLDAIRARLGTLAPRLVDTDEGGSLKHDSTPETHAGAATRRAGRPLFERAWPLVAVVALLVGIAAVGVRVAEHRAEYVMTYAYYDPLYAVMAPMPALVQSVLPANVLYNTPFVVGGDAQGVTASDRGWYV